MKFKFYGSYRFQNIFRKSRVEHISKMVVKPILMVLRVEGTMQILNPEARLPEPRGLRVFESSRIIKFYKYLENLTKTNEEDKGQNC